MYIKYGSIYIYTKVDWELDCLKSSYDEVISDVSDFFDKLIQALQHRWKKFVDHKKGRIAK